MLSSFRSLCSLDWELARRIERHGSSCQSSAIFDEANHQLIIVIVSSTTLERYQLNLTQLGPELVEVSSVDIEREPYMAWCRLKLSAQGDLVYLARSNGHVQVFDSQLQQVCTAKHAADPERSLLDLDQGYLDNVDGAAADMAIVPANIASAQDYCLVLHYDGRLVLFGINPRATAVRWSVLTCLQLRDHGFNMVTCLSSTLSSVTVHGRGSCTARQATFRLAQGTQGLVEQTPAENQPHAPLLTCQQHPDENRRVGVTVTGDVVIQSPKASRCIAQANLHGLRPMLHSHPLEELQDEALTDGVVAARWLGQHVWIAFATGRSVVVDPTAEPLVDLNLNNPNLPGYFITPLAMGSVSVRDSAPLQCAVALTAQHAVTLHGTGKTEAGWLSSLLPSPWLETKPQRSIVTTYVLAALQSTTPELHVRSLLARKQYAEALRASRLHGLNPDRVYQLQWDSARIVTVAAVGDWLQPVGDKTWVALQASKLGMPAV